MIRNDRLFCDHCHREMVRLTERECLNDIMPHGWTDYKTAHVHICTDCANEWNPPCDICRTPWRCVEWGECWADPPWPYESHTSDRIDEYELWQAFNKWNYNNLDIYFQHLGK